MKRELYVVYHEWPDGEEHSYWQKGDTEKDCLRKIFENHGYASKEDFVQKNGEEGRDFIRSIERDNFFWYDPEPIIVDYSNRIPAWVKS